MWDKLIPHSSAARRVRLPSRARARVGKSRRSATLFFSRFPDTELQLALQFKYLNMK